MMSQGVCPITVTQFWLSLNPYGMSNQSNKDGWRRKTLCDGHDENEYTPFSFPYHGHFARNRGLLQRKIHFTTFCHERWAYSEIPP